MVKCLAYFPIQSNPYAPLHFVVVFSAPRQAPSPRSEAGYVACGVGMALDTPALPNRSGQINGALPTALAWDCQRGPLPFRPCSPKPSLWGKNLPPPIMPLDTDCNRSDTAKNADTLTCRAVPTDGERHRAPELHVQARLAHDTGSSGIIAGLKTGARRPSIEAPGEHLSALRLTS